MGRDSSPRSLLEAALDNDKVLLLRKNYSLTNNNATMPKSKVKE
jgi:hypothetical protein